MSPVQAIAVNGRELVPERSPEGVTDERLGASAIWYPQPFGFEAEWNVGRGPRLTDGLSRIDSHSLEGGYAQLNYRAVTSFATWFPFVRWTHFDGGRKFARNAPHMRLNELDIGFEFAKWAELEATLMYTRTFERTRTSLFPYAATKNANRLGFQIQWNY